MLESLLATTNGETLTLTSALGGLGSALLLGLMISLVYIHTHKKEGYSAGFTMTMIMLPAIISVIIMLIGNNVARAFSLAGAFSLVRFRSAPGEPKDIAYVLFALSTGLACGMGYIAYGAIFAAIISACLLILHHGNFARPDADAMQLKITVPEDLNYQGLFDEVLDTYANSWTLKRVKTSNFGTLFEVAYNINLKQSLSQKDFLDELRCRNGNLSIVLTVKENEDRVYAYY